MKTAMQELIDELNELSNYYYTKSEYDTCNGIGISIEHIMTKIEKEKQRMFHCFNAGADVVSERRFNQWFNETYNQNK
jgi:hypothetical protein